MAENYKLLYQQMKRLVETYQDEIVPAMRKKIEDLQAENKRLEEERDEMHRDVIAAEEYAWKMRESKLAKDKNVPAKCPKCQSDTSVLNVSFCTRCGLYTLIRGEESST